MNPLAPDIDGSRMSSINPAAEVVVVEVLGLLL
jgi:hypothetical protein